MLLRERLSTDMASSDDFLFSNLKKKTFDERLGADVIKLFSCLTQLSMKF